MFPNGEMVLLSERETDGILLALSRSASQSSSSLGSYLSGTQPQLVHLSYTASEQYEPRMKANPLMRAAKSQSHAQRSRLRSHTKAPDTALPVVWVFSGWATVPEHAKDAVKAFVKGGRRAVEHIVAARGHGHMLPRSDLERLLT